MPPEGSRGQRQAAHPAVLGHPLCCLAGHGFGRRVGDGRSLRLGQDPLRGGRAPAREVGGLQGVSRVVLGGEWVRVHVGVGVSMRRGEVRGQR